MTYSQALAFLAALDRHGIKPGLERIRRLCELAGDPQYRFGTILVGGTNGKGSTCAFLASILTAAGHRVGSSPKPDLYTPRERLQVDGDLCSEEAFAALVEEIAPLIARVAADPHSGPVTYFEAMTLMAFLWFARQDVDWAVVEVGLGGRLDATNVLEPDASVITNIGLDHMDRLGSTVEAIAGEKAGILRAGQPALTGATGAALPVIEETAARLGVPMWRLDPRCRPAAEIRPSHVRIDASGSAFDLETPVTAWRNLLIRLPGEHQVANAALAAATAARLREEGLNASDGEIRTGLAKARFPGRLERLREEPLLLIDAAHNPDGARALAAALRALYRDPGRRLILVLALSDAHQPEEMAAVLAPLADRLIATASRHVQATPAKRVVELARRHLPTAACSLAPTVPDAVRTALADARPEDLVCVTGSIFAIAEVPRSAPAR